MKIKLKGDFKKDVESRRSQLSKKVIEKVVVELKENTPVDTGEARDGWHIEGNSIVNNVEHIDYLNAGSSKQAPAFFIEKTIVGHPSIVPRGIIVRSK